MTDTKQHKRGAVSAAREISRQRGMARKFMGDSKMTPNEQFEAVMAKIIDRETKLDPDALFDFLCKAPLYLTKRGGDRGEEIMTLGELIGDHEQEIKEHLATFATPKKQEATDGK